MAIKKKAEPAQSGESGLSAKLKNVRVLLKTNRVKEAIAYLYILYSKIAAKAWGVDKKPSQSMRDYAMILVRTKGHNPVNANAFVQCIEQTIYGGKQASMERFDEALDLFKKLVLEITGKQIPNF